MIVPKTPWASRPSSGVRTRSLRKIALMVTATPLLAAGFVFIGTSTAVAAPASTAYQTIGSFDPAPPCRGDSPGVCPPSIQSNEPTTVNQTPNS